MDISRRTALGAALMAGAALSLPRTPGRADAALPALPLSPIAVQAHYLIDRELSAPLRNHSLRGYLFGRAIAVRRGMKPGNDYNDETMYLICVLHDIGLSAVADGDQRFEVDGADYAAEFLERNGITDERVDIIWDAIAAHTSGLYSSPVHRRRRPAEIWLAVEGIALDVGGGPADLPPGYADLVHAVYPRLGGSRALGQAIENQALAKPQKARSATLAGEIVHQRYPELPYMTWDKILEGSGWGD